MRFKKIILYFSSFLVMYFNLPGNIYSQTKVITECTYFMERDKSECSHTTSYLFDDINGNVIEAGENHYKILNKEDGEIYDNLGFKRSVVFYYVDGDKYEYLALGKNYCFNKSFSAKGYFVFLKWKDDGYTRIRYVDYSVNP